MRPTAERKRGAIPQSPPGRRQRWCIQKRPVLVCTSTMDTFLSSDFRSDRLGEVSRPGQAARLRRLWTYALVSWVFFALTLATFVALFTTTRDISSAVGSGYMWFSAALLTLPYLLTAAYSALVWSDGERWNRGARHGLHTQWQGALTLAAGVLVVVPFWLAFVIRVV